MRFEGSGEDYLCALIYLGLPGKGIENWVAKKTKILMF